MRIRVEFTTEPFRGEGEPPRHAVAAYESACAAGLATDFGPFGTTVAGNREAVVAALPRILDAAVDGGADRITLQLVVEPEGRV